MSWFRREPPPPPPKRTVPGWVTISVPIIFAVVLGLLGIVYNGLAEELKTKADKEVTLQQIETNQKILEKHQMSLDQTLEVIIRMQAEREAQERYEKENPTPPGGFKMMPSYGYKAEPEKPAISPEQFQQYLKMNTEERAAFRKLHPSYATLPK